MIIGINGFKGSGKSTFTEFFISASKGLLNPDVTEMTFAGPIKRFAADTLGCSLEDLESQEFKETNLPECFQNKGLGMITYRHFLQRFGTEAVRDNVHPDFWVQVLLNKLGGDYFLSTGESVEQNVVVSDIRFENEFDAIRGLGGLMVRINKGGPDGLHSSETILDRRFDLVIDNSGSLEDLRTQALNLVNLLNSRSTPL